MAPLKIKRNLRVVKNPRPLGPAGDTPQTLAARLPKFTPFVAPKRPPTGTYDPAIDAQVGASDRGFEDVKSDAGIARLQGATDTQVASEAIDRGAGRSLADLLRSSQRGAQDFAGATAERGRQYGNLAQSQANAAVQQGVQSGGTLRAALEARAANQGREQASAQQGFDRFNADNLTANGRVKEDQGLAHGALTLQADRTLGDSGSIDRTVDRAGREHTFFGADAGNQRWFEASRMGVQMPTAPKGEFKTAAGNSYRVLKGAKRTLYLWPDGIKRPTRPA